MSRHDAGPVRSRASAEGAVAEPEPASLSGPGAERQKVFTDASGVPHYTEPALPPAVQKSLPPDTSAEIQRQALRLAIEAKEAELARRRARKAVRSEGRFVREDGSVVDPFVAFPDSVNLDGSEMLDRQGNTLVEPGFASRWVRLEGSGNPDDRDSWQRVHQLRREGYQYVIDPETKEPFRGPLGVAMQAPVDVAARRTMNKMPYGAADLQAPVTAVNEATEQHNAGLGYTAIRPWPGSKREQHVEEHLLTPQG